MIVPYAVTLTTASDGSATGYVGPLNGIIRKIGYVKTDFTDGVDITFSGEISLETIAVATNLNASKQIYPLALAQGIADLTTDLTTIYAPIIMANERLKIVVASGGSTHTGKFTVYIETDK